LKNLKSGLESGTSREQKKILGVMVAARLAIIKKIASSVRCNMVTVEVIPFQTFKERIRLVKELTKTIKPKYIEIYNTYIYIEVGGTEDDREYAKLQGFTRVN
jgi:hypothetical protein